jgi:hypothetical protein
MIIVAPAPEPVTAKVTVAMTATEKASLTARRRRRA